MFMWSLCKLLCFIGCSPESPPTLPVDRGSLWFLRHSSWSLPPLGGAEAEQNNLSSAPSWYRSSALSGMSFGASTIGIVSDRRDTVSGEQVRDCRPSSSGGLLLFYYCNFKRALITSPISPLTCMMSAHSGRRRARNERQRCDLMQILIVAALMGTWAQLPLQISL